jgi:protein O-mannose beta-1,4-N-acetylglucosaminyltransferase
VGTVEGHPYLQWDFDEVSPFATPFRNLKVRYEEDLHILHKRFHPENIMHNFHDDIISIFHLVKEFVGGGDRSLNMPFSLDRHRIMFIDENPRTQTERLFQYLSNKSLRYSSYLESNESVVTCFRDAILGAPTLTTWYQYGFLEPQGPLNKTVNGMHIREVAEWYTRRIGLPIGFDEDYEWLAELSVRGDSEQLLGKSKSSIDLIGVDYIVIMSRTRNRLILNEQQLASHIESKFNLEVKFLRNEEMRFEEQVTLLRRARIVIGMHGSILIMTMFCRRGTVVVEMFPYAIPAENYTPYKTLAGLPGMDLVYKAWEVRSHAGIPYICVD